MMRSVDGDCLVAVWVGCPAIGSVGFAAAIAGAGNLTAAPFNGCEGVPGAAVSSRAAKIAISDRCCGLFTAAEGCAEEMADIGAAATTGGNAVPANGG
jgi:hypothetical protein